MQGIKGRGVGPWSFQSRPALLVMDMQSFFLDECSPAFLPSAPSMVPNVRRLIEAFRASRLPVVFTVHKDQGGPMQRWWGRSMDEAWSHEPVFEVSQEEVVVKDVYDAFHNTELESILAAKKVGSVVVAGVCTHLCIESTVRSAFCRGYQVVVPADATACHNLAFHRASLMNMAHGFAHVDTTEGIIRRLDPVCD